MITNLKFDEFSCLGGFRIGLCVEGRVERNNLVDTRLTEIKTESKEESTGFSQLRAQLAKTLHQLLVTTILSLSFRLES